ncbi:acyl-CoA dehydrogenase family protein [Halosegnis longus]|uniref:acyl-CoA dehydrogenase family protein n=1 Tax=Halosegnis longus TaxID=2216012 RepID=UPI00129DBCEF|nr:acyl-CoA dehydrogenase family protein [Halosegnis longus]
MPFHPTDAQTALRTEAREFAAEQIVPVADELDREARYPADIMAALGDRRWTGLTLPESVGGLGRGYVALALVTEELAAASMPVASALNLHLGVAQLIAEHGTPAQRDRWLDSMATFETVAALGLSEDNAGSDKSGIETTAERDGEGWRLTGHKRWVSNFHEADLVCTYARTGDEPFPGGITAFLVDTEAFTLDREWDTLGARPVPACRVTLDDAVVSDDRRLGAVGEGYRHRSTVANGVNVPARGVGIARAARDAAAAHTTDREQGGTPLADRQGVRWELASLTRRVETARAVTLRAADRADRGLDYGQAMATAKLEATEAAVDNANDALQLHGGIGYTRERSVERYLRDAKLLTIAGGPNAGHRDALGAAVVEEHR